MVSIIIVQYDDICKKKQTINLVYDSYLFNSVGLDWTMADDSN